MPWAHRASLSSGWSLEPAASPALAAGAGGGGSPPTTMALSRWSLPVGSLESLPVSNHHSLPPALVTEQPGLAQLGGGGVCARGEEISKCRTLSWPPLASLHSHQGTLLGRYRVCICAPVTRWEYMWEMGRFPSRPATPPNVLRHGQPRTKSESSKCGSGWCLALLLSGTLCPSLPRGPPGFSEP